MNCRKSILAIQKSYINKRLEGKIKRFHHDFQTLYIIQCTTRPQNELEEKWRDLLPQHVKNKP